MSITNFIRHERIYIWMAFFILVINLINLNHPVKISDSEKSISTKTFKEMGISEEKIRSFLESKKPKAIFFKYSLLAGFFIFIAGIIVNLNSLLRKKQIIPKIIPYKKSVSWGISDIVRAVIIIIFTGYVLNITGGMFFKVAHINMDINLRMMLATFFIDIIALVVVLHFVLVKYKERLNSLGLVFSDLCKNIFSGITAYISIVPILLVVLILSISFLDMLKYRPPPQPVIEVFLQEKRDNVILFLTLFASLLGPVIEEVFFRGFLYNALKKNFGMLLAIVLSAALFSTLHANVVGFIPIMILGILMACLYEATGSLIASMAAHILHNSITIAFVFFIRELLH